MSAARDQIIEKTCELLELQGYYATGLNQIVNESGSPKGSLYYYFPGGKEELAAAAIEQAGAVVLQRIQDQLAELPDAADAIRTFIMNIAHYVELSGYRAGGPLTTVALETASSSVRLRDVCDRIYNSWQAAFAAKLTGTGLAEARAAQLAMVIIAAIEGGTILCRTSQSRMPLETIALETTRWIKAAQ